MNRIKKFFQTLWYYIIFPYYWLTTRSIEKRLTKRIEADKRSLFTEKDVEFLRSLGIETDLETLRNGNKTKKR